MTQIITNCLTKGACSNIRFISRIVETELQVTFLFETCAKLGKNKQCPKHRGYFQQMHHMETFDVTRPESYALKHVAFGIYTRRQCSSGTLPALWGKWGPHRMDFFSRPTVINPGANTFPASNYSVKRSKLMRPRHRLYKQCFLWKITQ